MGYLCSTRRIGEILCIGDTEVQLLSLGEGAARLSLTRDTVRREIEAAFREPYYLARDVSFVLARAGGSRVRFAVSAPDDVPVDRMEVRRQLLDT